MMNSNTALFLLLITAAILAFVVQGQSTCTPADEKWLKGITDAKLHAKDRKERTLLMEAAKEGNLCKVEGLLAKGAKANEVDKEHTSALNEAAKGGHLNVVKALLDKGGAKMKLYDRKGYGALSWAAMKGYADIADYLLKKGDNIDHPCVHGHTPVMLAADYNQGDMVELLISSGAKVNIYTHGGASGLLHASGKGYTNIVRTLLENGAKVDIHTRKKKHTAALVAAQGGFTDTMVVLLEYGASIRYEDADNKNCLSYACEGNHQPMAELLIKHGANLQRYLDKNPKANNVCTNKKFIEANLKHAGDEM